MDYFRINTLPLVDKTFCILEGGPEGTNAFDYKLSDGEAVTGRYPANARWYMSPKHPTRLKVPSVVDNTSSLLIVHRDVKDVLAATGVAMECLPFTLYDHKRRVASSDHFIVNPLGSFDCLDLARSEIQWSKEYPDKIIGIDRFVLDPKKLESAPDLFRIQLDLQEYVVSHRLIERLRPLQPTNLFLLKLDQ